MPTPDHMHIDNLFRDHFRDHEIPVHDRAGLWQRIKPARRTNRVLLFITISVLAISGLVLSWSYTRNGSAGGGGYEAETLLSQNEKERRHEKSLIALLEKAETKGDQVISEELPKLNHGPITSEEREQRQDQRTSLMTEQDSDGSTSILTTLEKDALVSSRSAFNESAPLEQGQKEEDLVVIKSELAFVQNEEKSEDRASLTLLPHMLIGRSRDLTFLPSRIDDLAISIPAYSAPNSNKILACEMGKSPGHLFADIYIGAALPLDRLALNAGFEDQGSYLDTWRSRYQSLGALSAGASIGYEMASGLGLSAGIEYQRLESQYESTQTITEIIMVYDPMAYFFVDDMGQTVWVADSVTAVSRYDRLVQNANTTTLVGIPVQVSYPLMRKGPWDIKLLFAGIFNLSLKHEGHHLREDLSLIVVDETNSSTYMAPGIGVSLEGGAHIGYFMGDRWELYASPRFRYNRQSYLNQNGPLSLSRNFVGIRAGLQYHF